MTIATRCKALLRCSSILAVVRRSSSNSFLAKRHDRVVEQTQNLLKKIQSEFAILSVDEKQLLNDAQRRIDSIFLFVVVGEFNSGKSQFINTFLGEKELCPTGVLPTTDTVNIIRYGTKREDRRDDEHIRSIFVPNEWLKQTNIVDTPGTNAILQSHQQITEHFIPQSDFVMFITSVDRPFSESERLFLLRIRQWRKKVLIILNKIDQIRNEADGTKILEFVQKNARDVLEEKSIRIFPLSALNDVGFADLREFLAVELNDTTKLKLKLENPLGIVERIFDENIHRMKKREEVLRQDEKVIEVLRGIIDEYRRQTAADFQFQTNKIDNIFFRMTDNLEEFLLEHLQLSRLLPTLFSPSHAAEFKVQFNQRVNQNIEEDIQQCIGHLCDWLVERSNRTLQQLDKSLGNRSTRSSDPHRNVDLDFARSRQQILQQLQSQSSNVLYKRNTSTASQTDELSASVRSTMFGTAAIEVGAVGFGALAALASFDWTGLLGASLLGIFGLYFIPMRRSTIKREMKEKIDKTRIELVRQLEKHFNIELDLNERKMRDLILPYTEFVEEEKRKVAKTIGQIEEARREMALLRQNIEKHLPS